MYRLVYNYKYTHNYSMRTNVPRRHSSTHAPTSPSLLNTRDLVPPSNPNPPSSIHKMHAKV